MPLEEGRGRGRPRVAKLAGPPPKGRQRVSETESNYHRDQIRTLIQRGRISVDEARELMIEEARELTGDDMADGLRYAREIIPREIGDELAPGTVIKVPNKRKRKPLRKDLAKGLKGLRRKTGPRFTAQRAEAIARVIEIATLGEAAYGEGPFAAQTSKRMQHVIEFANATLKEASDPDRLLAAQATETHALALHDGDEETDAVHAAELLDELKKKNDEHRARDRAQTVARPAQTTQDGAERSETNRTSVAHRIPEK